MKSESIPINQLAQLVKQSYCLPEARTNYGKFNVRLQGPVIWNAIDYDIKFSSISLFLKNEAKSHWKLLADSLSVNEILYLSCNALLHFIFQSILSLL